MKIILGSGWTPMARAWLGLKKLASNWFWCWDTTKLVFRLQWIRRGLLLLKPIEPNHHESHFPSFFFISQQSAQFDFNKFPSWTKCACVIIGVTCVNEYIARVNIDFTVALNRPFYVQVIQCWVFLYSDPFYAGSSSFKFFCLGSSTFSLSSESRSLFNRTIFASDKKLLFRFEFRHGLRLHWAARTRKVASACFGQRIDLTESFNATSLVDKITTICWFTACVVESQKWSSVFRCSGISLEDS